MSAIIQHFACVIMIDVAEGDCYVVDLLNKDGASLDDQECADNWIRYLIDTGSKIENRVERIMAALTVHNVIDPWPKPDCVEKRLPILGGVIITHSDRDHSGNAHEVLRRMDLDAWKPSIFAEKTKLINGVPVYISPMVQWTRTLGHEKVPEFIRIQGFQGSESEEIGIHKEAEIEVKLVDMPVTVDRSFNNLEQLCGIADYSIQYRFNILNTGSDDQILQSKKGHKPLESTDVPQSVWQSEWQDSNRKDVMSLAKPLEGKLLIPKYPLSILVEVALVPKESCDRTFLGAINKIVTGPWLRTICKLDKDKVIKTEMPVELSIQEHKSSFRVQLINHCEKYNKILEQGPWSASVMGCADGKYVRDFQYMILQSIAPNDLLGLDTARKDNLWSEYANRASIINFFTFHASLMPQEDGAAQAPLADKGLFKMLFTGDAFELSEGLGKMTKLREAWKIPQESNLLDYGFISQPHSISTPGNLMNWLSGQENQNQQVELDVLKVPHHGSGVTSDPGFYSFVTASVYLISGSFSQHGHPTIQTMFHIVSSIWRRDEKKVAKPPRSFRSKETKSGANPPISERPRPRLIFMSFATQKDRGDFGASDLAKLCKHGNGLVNVKWFVQKEKDSSSRLRFGRDKNRDHSLRVEWDTAAWVELRPDGLTKDLHNTADDPLAYPLPGESPDWEAVAPNAG